MISNLILFLMLISYNVNFDFISISYHPLICSVVAKNQLEKNWNKVEKMLEKRHERNWLKSEKNTVTVSEINDYITGNKNASGDETK